LEKVLLSVDETAEILSLGPATVRFLVKAGQLDSVKIKSRHLILRSSVDDYVLRLTQEGSNR